MADEVSSEGGLAYSSDCFSNTSLIKFRVTRSKGRIIPVEKSKYLQAKILWGGLPHLDCSQSPIFSGDRLDIPRLTAMAILIFKCTEGAGTWDCEQSMPHLDLLLTFTLQIVLSYISNLTMSLQMAIQTDSLLLEREK